MPSIVTLTLILIVCALLSFLRHAFAYKVTKPSGINFDALGKALLVGALIAAQYGGR